MRTRLVVGLGGLALLLPALFLGGERAVEIIATLALLVALDEYARMAVPHAPLRALGLLLPAGGGLYAAMLWGTAASVAGSLLLGAALVLVGTLFLEPDTRKGADVAGRLALGVVYAPAFLAALVWVRRFEHGLAWLFIVLGAAWVGDTGAYFAGRAFGRHKLFERVSPKKTWEGALGGMAFSVAWTLAIRAFFLPELPWAHALALGVLLDAAGVVGDLVESMLKRSFGVKDSGRIMPGHGGILDRIDSVLLIAPICWAWVAVFGLG